MMFTNPSLGDLADDAATYRALAADLDKLATGWRPDDAVLAVAPTLLLARYSSRPETCLTGVRVGQHPKLGDAGPGRVCATSGIITMSESEGWARTISRWWRIEMGDKP